MSDFLVVVAFSTAMRFVLLIAVLLLTSQVISAAPDVFIPLLPEQREKLLALFRRFTRRLSSALTDDVLQSRRGKSRRMKWKRRPKRSSGEYCLDCGEHEPFMFSNNGMNEPIFLIRQSWDVKFKEQFGKHIFREKRHLSPPTRRGKKSRTVNGLSKRGKNVFKNKRKNKNIKNCGFLKKSLVDKRVRKSYIQPKLVDRNGVCLCCQRQDPCGSDSSHKIRSQLVDAKSIKRKQTANLNGRFLNKCIRKKAKFKSQKSYYGVEDGSEFGTSDTTCYRSLNVYPTVVNYAQENKGYKQNQVSSDYLSDSINNMCRNKKIKYNCKEPFLTSSPTPIYSDRILFPIGDEPINNEMLDLHIDDRNVITSDKFPEITNYYKNERVLETAVTGKIPRKQYKCQHNNEKYLETFPRFECRDPPEMSSKSSEEIGHRHDSHRGVYDDAHSRLPNRVHSSLTLANFETFWDPPKEDEYEHVSESFSLKSIYDFVKQGINSYRIVKHYIQRGWPFVYR